MYAKAKTWNPFKGCKFDCIYCKPSFQRQAKRQKHNCPYCYEYVPHYHFLEPQRINGKKDCWVPRKSTQASIALESNCKLPNIPISEIVFVCGLGDISFCNHEFTLKIIETIKEHNRKCPYKTYYFQSKRPEYFKEFLYIFPDNVFILTTLETNRDSGYEKYSKATLPTKRYNQFLSLDYPRKVVTIEPLMDFDLDIFPNWIVNIAPEYVWLGFNSKLKQVRLPEPSVKKILEFVRILSIAGVKIRQKDLRGINIGI